MRNNVLVLLGLFFFFLVDISPVVAQDRRVLYQPLTWEQASLLATRENKIVFADVSDGGISVSGRLESALFGNKLLADFFSKHVIAIRIDMQTAAGKNFVPKLLLNDYPLYGFFMPYGDLLDMVKPDEAVKNPRLLRTAAEEALKRAVIKKTNSRSIRFEDITLEDALGKAKKEGKPIFIHLYADDNQDCILMDKNIFNLNRVADFYNKYFINLKINSERNVEWAKKYGISAWPAFLFLNGEGKKIYLSQSYMEPEVFIGQGEMALKKAEGIEFSTGTRTELAEQARRQGKLIFTDCYTSTEATRKTLVKTVYTDPEVAEFFNAHFVNNRLNMDAGEGITFREEYGVNVSPALYFTDAEGKMIHRVVGSPDGGELLREARRASDGRGVVYMAAAYRGGNREPAFVEEYLRVLEVAGMKEVAPEIALEYLSRLDVNRLKELKYWELFEKYVVDVHSSVFNFVYAHRNDFYILFGEVRVKQKLTAVWEKGACDFLTTKEQGYGYDEAGFKEYVKRMKKEKVENWRWIVRNAGMSRAEKTDDWKTYVELAEEKWKEERISDAELYSWGVKINKECSDEAIRFKAARWFALSADEMARKEWKTGKVNLSSYKGFFEKLVKDLVGEK